MNSLHNARRGKKCAFYLRTNRNQEHQTGSNSIDSQKENLLDRASREGMEVVDVYIDAGKSGGNISGRDELQRMLNDITTGRIGIDYVMVSEPSRLGRNTKDVLNILAILQQHGVNLLCPRYACN